MADLIEEMNAVTTRVAEAAERDPVAALQAIADAPFQPPLVYKPIVADAWAVLCGRCGHSKRAHLVPGHGETVKRCTFQRCTCHAFVEPVA